MPQTRQIAMAAALVALALADILVAVTPRSASSAAVVADALTAISAPRPVAAAPAASPTAVTTAPTKVLVAVSVAEVWAGRHRVRPFDAPALQRPARISAWLHGMTFFQRSHLFQRLATQVRYGEQLVALGTWGSLTRVRIPDQTGGRFPDGIIGWMASDQLAPQPADWNPSGRVATVTAERAVVTRTVDGTARSLTISYATTLPVVRVRRHTVVVDVPGRAPVGRIARSTVTVHRAGTPAIQPSARHVLAQAKRFLGLPYLWAGMTSWGFDCSGLTSTIYSQLGITLPRDAADQSLVGTAVPRGQLRPGDLVFFSPTRSRGDIHHVAIYAGNGWVIQSPYTGARVEITKIRGSYLNREYWGASRPLSVARSGRT